MSPKEPSEIKIKELISFFEKKKFDELLRFSNELLDAVSYTHLTLPTILLV